jgi:hypothetical protein
MTITLTREEAQQVLDALENLASMAGAAWTTDNPIETLRARLSAPEPKEFTDKEKIVCDILCSDETPPNGQHWEGFVAQKIVKALAQPEPEQTDESCLFHYRIQKAQPEPEPVAWGIANTRPTEKHPLMMVMTYKPEPSSLVVPLYTAPPQREWQGLTDAEISELIRNTHNTGSFVRAIEAKLKEKNA